MGVALFALGSVLCAVAPSTELLLAGRAIAGAGAALELPMSLVLLALAYPAPESRARALGIWASCNGIAFIVGPTFGGLMVDTIGWRSIFYLILPLSALALLLALKVGLGLGLNTAPVNNVAVSSAPRERSGTASGLLNTARKVGATFGIAILGTVFACHAGQAAGAEAFLPGRRHGQERRDR